MYTVKLVLMHRCHTVAASERRICRTSYDGNAAGKPNKPDDGRISAWHDGCSVECRPCDGHAAGYGGNAAAAQHVWDASRNGAAAADDDGHASRHDGYAVPTERHGNTAQYDAAWTDGRPTENKCVV